MYMARTWKDNVNKDDECTSSNKIERFVSSLLHHKLCKDRKRAIWFSWVGILNRFHDVYNQLRRLLK